MAQNLSKTPMPGVAILYEWIIHPVFLRLFTGLYRFSTIYRSLLGLSGDPAYERGRPVKVLDMACGTFWFGRTRLRDLLERGAAPEVFGADISENLIEAAHGIMGRMAVPEETWHLSVEDAQNLPFADGTFQEVWICGALHQIPGPERTIDEIARLLAPGGLMFCQTFLAGRGPLARRIQKRVAGSGFDFMDREMLHTRLTQRGLTRCGWKESGMTGVFVYRKDRD